MARTFNRNPLFVNSPNRNEDKKYVFNQTNFKGLSNNKNAFTVDQETFSECENVYIDSEGLLKSRPALKIFTEYNGIDKLSTVLNVWTFDDTTVYLSTYEDNYYLTFICDEVDVLQTSTVQDVKLVQIEKVIFVLSDTFLNKYYVDNDGVHYENAEIYIPIHKTVFRSVMEENEPLNELTESYIIRYVFDNLDSINFTELIGKYVTVNVNENEYSIKFVENNQYVFLSKLKYISDVNFYNDELAISVSKDKGTGILCELHDSHVSIYYTVDFITFTILPLLEGIIGIPKITDDGFTVIAMKADDLYAIGVVPTSDNTFQTWTPLIQHLDRNFYVVNREYMTFNTDSSFYAITYDEFIVCTNVKMRWISVEQKTDVLISIISHEGVIELDTITTDLTLTPGILNSTKIQTDVYDEDFGPQGEKVYYYQDVSFTSNGKTIEFSNIEIHDFEDDVNSLGQCITFFVSSRFAGNEQDNAIEQLYFPFTSQSGYTEYDFTSFGYKLSILANRYMFSLDIEFVPDERCLTSTWYKATPLKCVCKIEDGKFKYAISTTNGVCTNYLKLKNYAHLLNPTSPRLVSVGINKDIVIGHLKYPYTLERNDILIKNNKLYTIISSNDVKYLCETNFSSYSLYNVDDSTYFKFSTEGHLFTDKYIYNTLKYESLNDSKIPYLFPIVPVYLSFPLALSLAYEGNHLYSISSNTAKSITIDELVPGENKYILPSHIVELDNWYIAKNNVLYISSYVNGNDYKWYFPKINTEHIDYDITALHPISTNEMGVFTENNIYYVRPSESGYLYYKSKLATGCKQGSNVITSYDGKYILFVSTRGLLALTYQQLVESTEQILTFLSDTIYDFFKEYNTKPVLLHQYDYWILCYKRDASNLLVFDLRNNSWWPIAVPYNIDKIYTANDKLYAIANNNVFTLSKSSEDYFDYNGTDSERILWKIRSQKLHLNSIDYCKHIDNLTLCSVQDSNEPITLDLSVTTYRKRSTSSEIKNFEFKVDAVRTYIKRLNYFKVNEFQYYLESSDIVNNIPLSLASISIKYKMAGQVR